MLIIIVTILKIFAVLPNDADCFKLLTNPTIPRISVRTGIKNVITTNPDALKITIMTSARGTNRARTKLITLNIYA
jgi:hypothetical protein